jgi:hypothetical protein
MLNSFIQKQYFEDEYHFILQCEKYIDVRKRYLKKYHWQMPSCFKLVQLLSVLNIKELNNLGIMLNVKFFYSKAILVIEIYI